MLIKLRLDELSGQEILPFDVLDGHGHVVFQAGDELDRRRLERMAAQGLFRHHEKLPLIGVLQEERLGRMTQADLAEVSAGPDPWADTLTLDYLVQREEALPYMKGMMAFWQKIQAGGALDMALLEVLQAQLVSDIVGRMDQLRYLNQLRLRDGVTYSHTLDVTSVSIALGAKLGLDRRDLETLALGALLHDLGKLFIPRAIMFKPTRLTDKEFEVMQLHPEIGYRIIREELKLPEEVARPALEHQELFAGGGYPLNLIGAEIHPFSQIVKIADVYDALTSKRPYKESICSYKAIRIMLLEGAQSFNPKLLRTFLELANFPEDEIPADL